MLYNINEDRPDLVHTLTEKIYEYCSSYETTTTIGKVYLKYDVQTGILLRCEEELKLTNGDLDAEVIFSYGGNTTLSVDYNNLLLLILGLLSSLIIIHRRRNRL